MQGGGTGGGRGRGYIPAVAELGEEGEVEEDEQEEGEEEKGGARLEAPTAGFVRHACSP